MKMLCCRVESEIAKSVSSRQSREKSKNFLQNVQFKYSWMGTCLNLILHIKYFQKLVKLTHGMWQFLLHFFTFLFSLYENVEFMQTFSLEPRHTSSNLNSGEGKVKDFPLLSDHHQ